MIALSQHIKATLDRRADLSAAVKKSVSDFDSWISRSTLTFFPEYTDHGPQHITDVLASAENIMTGESLDLLTPEDAGALVLAVLLHDSAMHITNDGFRRLVSGQTSLLPIGALGDRPWPSLWDAFLAEAARFSPAQNVRLFGDPAAVTAPSLDDWNWNAKQILLAGEFLRRHHPRLAHQIAQHGFPGASDESLQLDGGINGQTRDIVGLIARSHGMGLRPCLDYLRDVHANRIDPERIRALFIMVVLRVADYLQIEAGRAPVTRIRMQAIRSTLSIREWKKHHAVPQLTYDENDPEARRAIVRVEEMDSISTYLSLRQLAQDIQNEIDGSWAVLGEVFGRLTQKDFPLYRLGLTIRRLRTNLDDPGFLNKLGFQPEAVRFQSADAQLFELLIEPLYGSQTDAGIRELVQNSVDAVRELQAYCRRHNINPGTLARVVQDSDVCVEAKEIAGQQYVIVQDRGIGMTLEIVRDYFLKVGASYRTSAEWKREFIDDHQHSTVLRTGYFGVGALAAFLLGDEVHVVTRHVTAAEGLDFTTSLRTETIQLNRAIDCPIGTTLTIPLRSELVAKKWSPHLRYFLAKPTVEVPGTSRDVIYPDADSRPSPDWQRLKASHRPIVFWRRNQEYVDRVVHNGFMIEHGDQALRTLWRDQWYGLRIFLPPLHILDYEGNQARPYLNLSRTEFLPDRFGPTDEVLVDVLRDYLAFLLVTTPSAVEAIQEPAQQQYRYLECLMTDLNHGFDSNNHRCAPILYTREGVCPFDAKALESLGITSIFLLNGGSPADILSLHRSFAVLPLAFDGYEERLMYPRKGIAPAPAGLNIVESTAYEASPDRDSKPLLSFREYLGPKLENGELTDETLSLKSSARAKLAKALLRKLPERGKPTIIHWSLDSPDKAPEPTVIESIARGFSRRSAAVESPLLIAWRGLLGDLVIPYDREARKAKFSAAFKKLAPYIASWTELSKRS